MQNFSSTYTDIPCSVNCPTALALRFPSFQIYFMFSLYLGSFLKIFFICVNYFSCRNETA